jgi:autotransporter-associated beta strand protein
VLGCAVAAVFDASLPRASAAPPAGYEIVFADEFNGTSLDTLKWNYNYPWGDGHTHNHIAWVVPEQVIVGNGRLNLQAIAQKHPDAPADHPYTSGTINTSGKLNLTHGYLEARMKMSDVQGTWPAFWMLQNGWPPEIDIMEFPRGGANSATQYWANWHYTGASGAASEGWQRTAANLTTAYNDFAVEWTATSMKFYLNGTLMNSVQNTASIAQAANMYLILNQAVGGWPGNPPSDAAFPSNFEVDWVRVWQQLPTGASATSTWNIDGTGTWDNSANWSGVVPKYGDQNVVFGRVGAAASAAVTWNDSRAIGGITFAGSATGTTAYTVGSSAGSLQLANSGAAGAQIAALVSSTTNQTINARLDLWNNTQVRNEMTGGQSLFLNGPIIGTSALMIDGPGTVVVSGVNNTYSGGTVIDSGPQGPGVVRVNGTGALGTGTITIGTGGNSTTARLEIIGGSRGLANNIDLRARTNSSVAIQQIAGTNTLTGTITAGVGGNIYLIQSDAGTLNLTARRRPRPPRASPSRRRRAIARSRCKARATASSGASFATALWARRSASPRPAPARGRSPARTVTPARRPSPGGNSSSAVQ